MFQLSLFLWCHHQTTILSLLQYCLVCFIQLWSWYDPEWLLSQHNDGKLIFVIIQINHPISNVWDFPSCFQNTSLLFSVFTSLDLVGGWTISLYDSSVHSLFYLFIYLQDKLSFQALEGTLAQRLNFFRVLKVGKGARSYNFKYIWKLIRKL